MATTEVLMAESPVIGRLCFQLWVDSNSISILDFPKGIKVELLQVTKVLSFIQSCESWIKDNNVNEMDTV